MKTARIPVPKVEFPVLLLKFPTLFLVSMFESVIIDQ